MGHMGQGLINECVAWVMGHVGYGSLGLLTGHVGYGSRGSRVTG